MARCSFPWTRFLALRVRVYCTRPGLSLERDLTIVPLASRISPSETFVLAICTSASSSGTLQCPLSRMCVCAPSTLPLHVPQYIHSLYTKTSVASDLRNEGMSQDEGMKSPWAVDMCERFASRDRQVCRQKRHWVDGGSSESVCDSEPICGVADEDTRLLCCSVSLGAGCAIS
jgi:hypothetical protein